MREDALHMNENDEIWMLIKSQLEFFLGKFIIGKTSECAFIDSNNKKKLWESIERSSARSSAEMGKKRIHIGYEQIV